LGRAFLFRGSSFRQEIGGIDMKTAKTLFGILWITLALAAQVQAQFNYNNNGDGTCTITGYTGTGGVVAIPGTINGLTVTAIGTGGADYVFLYTGVTLVTIPGSVTSIRDYSFDSCTSLTSITIPNSVTSIGIGAFIYCSNLTSVGIGNNVTSIGNYAFYSCTKLTGLYFEGDAPTVGESVFSSDNSATAYHLAASTGNFGFGLPIALWTYASLQVSISPSNADSAGAQWQVDEGPWQNSGATVTGLTVGSHVISYLPVTSFGTPSEQVVTVVSGQTTNVGANYIPLGSLQVFVTPNGAANAGALWQVDGTGWQTNGSVMFNLAAGNHTVEFSTIGGWATPTNQTVTVNFDQTTIATGTYNELGSLRVFITPNGAVSAGALWQVDSSGWQMSGSVVSNLAAGNHTVEFSTIGGWTPPTNQTVTANLNQTTIATGTYVEQFGDLLVVLSPAGAVSAGARWQVDDGPWQISGETVAGLTVGTHTLTFSVVPGWGVPTSETVGINFNQTANVAAAYSEPRAATATAMLNNGFVVGATVTDGGVGYTNIPLVRFIGGGGSGALAAAVVSNGVVIAVSVLEAGHGYTSTPLIVIDPPFIPNPVLGIAPMWGLVYSNLTIGGAYQLQQSSKWYWTNWPVNFTATSSVYTQLVSGLIYGGDCRLVLGPVPAQAFGVAEVDNGFVVGAILTTGGSGYVTNPPVSIVSDDGGVNATAVSEISSAGVVTNISITDAGSGYSDMPTIEIAPPPAISVAPTILPVMRVDSSSLAPYDNYQIQFAPALGTTWENWNGGLFIPTNVTNSQFVFITNATGFFRLEYAP
jgi:hypothetical protein